MHESYWFDIFWKVLHHYSLFTCKLQDSESVYGVDLQCSGFLIFYDLNVHAS